MTKSTQKPEESLLTTLQAFFRKEAERFQVRMVFLYGSQAHGIARQDSDVDVAVVFDAQLKEEEVFNRITTMSLELINLLGLEVSILPIYHDFRKPMLYYNGVVKGVPVFIKEAGAYARLRQEAVSRVEDFQIFGTRWQLEAARRNLSRG